MGKILILANNDIGLYKFRKELIEELINNNEIYISLPNGEFIKEFVKLGCEFIDTRIDRRGMNPIADFQLLLTYNKIIKNLKPDLVITYTIKPNIYGGFISRIRKINYVANITGLGTAFQKQGLLRKIIIIMYKASLKKAKAVFFENEKNLETVILNQIIVSDKAFNLNGAGVNVNEYHFTPYPKDYKNIRFLFIGRLMKEKGIYEFFDVAEKVKAENKNIQFDVIGLFEDDISLRLEQLEVNGIINFYGYQKDVRPFIENAHCFVLPSYHEGMANTLLECGAMGRPLITSNIPGCREAVVDCKNGYLTNVADSAHLYINICKFLSLSYESKVHMGNFSRIHIEENFNKLDVIKATMQVLKTHVNNSIQ